VAGTKTGQRLVIERSAHRAALWRAGPDGSAVLITNHYASRKFRDENNPDDNLAADSAGRLAGLAEGLARRAQTPARLSKTLSRPDVPRSDIQHQMVMSAREGVLRCRLPGGSSQAVTV